MSGIRTDKIHDFAEAVADAYARDGFISRDLDEVVHLQEVAEREGLVEKGDASFILKLAENIDQNGGRVGSDFVGSDVQEQQVADALRLVRYEPRARRAEYLIREEVQSFGVGVGTFFYTLSKKSKSDATPPNWASPLSDGVVQTLLDRFLQRDVYRGDLWLTHHDIVGALFFAERKDA